MTELEYQALLLKPGMRKANAHAVYAMEDKPTPVARVEETPCTKGMSEMERRLNKTEKRFLEVLRSREAQFFSHIGIQEITLRLAWDTRYTADFHAIWKDGTFAAFYEVKGFMRDDARVKLFTAAAKFPYWKFILVKWVNGAWTEELIRG